MDTSLYAFYGSLRRGMRLHTRFKDHLKYQYSTWLKGYDLYTLGNYPYAVQCVDPSHKIMVEVMRVDDVEIARTIHRIESEAGYHEERIKLGNEIVTLFLYDQPANNLRIISGDWGIFFGG